MGLKGRSHNSFDEAGFKLNRRNSAKQWQKKKETSLVEMSKLFSRKGIDKVQRIVAVLPMTKDLVPEEMVKSLLKSVGVQMGGEGNVRIGE